MFACQRLRASAARRRSDTCAPRRPADKIAAPRSVAAERRDQIRIDPTVASASGNTSHRMRLQRLGKCQGSDCPSPRFGLRNAIQRGYCVLRSTNLRHRRGSRWMRNFSR
jgi:hypothetical protein